MSRRTLLACAIVVLGSISTGAQGAWSLLGQRNVSDRLDHDTVMVTGAKGTFSAIRFEVRRHAIDFHRVVIHFANGDDQHVEMRDTIRARGESRVIDIEGRDRTIRSIEFWYDAKTLGRASATIRVLGRR